MTYDEFIENLVNADLGDNFYRKATVEQVLQEYDKFIQEEMEEMEFNYTRTTFFISFAEGITDTPKEEFITGMNLKRVEGEVWYDEEAGAILVFQKVARIEGELYATEFGKVVTIGENSDKSKPEGIAGE